ncbi:MAG: hypothetical protein JWO82_1906 [Akkermansiaceae bacterium]|nr:hypothetical protein [Akkermansiaceae bacterium]
MDCRTTAYAGNKIDFSFVFSAYPVSAGWTGSVVLRSASSRFTVALAASGNALVGSAIASVTATWPAGVYDLFVLVANGADRQTAHTQQITIFPDPGAATATPSALEADLARVDASISAVLAGEGVQSYQIQTQAGMRQVQRMSLADLRSHRSWLLGLIDAERAAAGLTRKNRRWKRIGHRFDT